MERNYKCLVCCISVNDHTKRRLLNPETSANRAVGLFFREHISRTYQFSCPEYTCTPCFRKLEGALRTWSNYQSAVDNIRSKLLGGLGASVSEVSQQRPVVDASTQTDEAHATAGRKRDATTVLQSSAKRRKTIVQPTRSQTFTTPKATPVESPASLIKVSGCGMQRPSYLLELSYLCSIPLCL